MIQVSDLTSKTALVTGGAKRIGGAIACALARHGVRTVIHYQSSQAEAALLVANIQHDGGHAWALQADLTKADEAQTLVSRAHDIVGPIDVLVNSASIFSESTLSTMFLDDLSTNLGLHAMAPLILTRAIAALRREACVINMLDARVNDYDAAHVAYHLSKRALHALTKMMAIEFAPSVRVNGIAPGLILPPEGKGDDYLEGLSHTNLLQRVGSVVDIVEAALFLVRSNFVTGEVLFIDGGRNVRGNTYG